MIDACSTSKWTTGGLQGSRTRLYGFLVKDVNVLRQPLLGGFGGFHHDIPLTNEFSQEKGEWSPGVEARNFYGKTKRKVQGGGNTYGFSCFFFFLSSVLAMYGMIDGLILRSFSYFVLKSVAYKRYLLTRQVCCSDICVVAPHGATFCLEDALHPIT